MVLFSKHKLNLSNPINWTLQLDHDYKTVLIFYKKKILDICNKKKGEINPETKLIC